MLLGRAHVVRQRFAEAEALLAAAEDGITAGADAIAYLGQRSFVLLWGLGRREDARALVDRARAWSDDPAWHARLEPLRLSAAGLSQEFAGAFAQTSAILAEPELDPDVRRATERFHAIAALFAGHVHEAEALAWRNRPAIPFRDQYDLLLLGSLSIIGVESGAAWADLDAYMAATLRDAVRANHGEAAGLAAFTLGHLRFLDGRFREAARWLAEAELRFEREDSLGSLLHVRALQLGIALATGEAGEVAPALAAMRAVLDGRDPVPTQRPYAARAEGWAERLRGDAAGADRLLHAAASSPTRPPTPRSSPTRRCARARRPARGPSSRRSRPAATAGSRPPTRRTPRRARRATARRSSTPRRGSPRSAPACTRWRRRPRRRRRSSPPAARTPPAAPRPAPASSTSPARGRIRRRSTGSTGPRSSSRGARPRWPRSPAAG